MKNKLFICISVIFICCAFQPGEDGFSKMKDVPAFRKGVDQMAASTHSIIASFQQEKYLSILSDKIVSEGSIHFKKPNLLRWEYHQPFDYGIILNGKEMVIKDEGNVNSFDIASSQTFQQINELIIHSVQGNVLDEQKFEVSYFENKDLYLAKLLPKEAQMAKFLKGIDIYFDRKNFTVSQIRLIESEEDYTLISFSNKKINEPIPDDFFAVR